MKGWASDIDHRDGVAWYDAPIPRRWHRCFVQTDGWLGLTRVWRCPCGAVALNGGPWDERNSRRKDVTR